jgi:hypothetical protein
MGLRGGGEVGVAGAADFQDFRFSNNLFTRHPDIAASPVRETTSPPWLPQALFRVLRPAFAEP